MFAHLHTRTWFSFLAGGSSPEALAYSAASVGADAAAITDRHGVQGAVRFQQACESAGVKPIFGAEVSVTRSQDGATTNQQASEETPLTSLVLLAENREGYANLNQLLTRAHLRDRERPAATLEEVECYAENLFCLTGAHGSRLWRLVDQRQTVAARSWVEDLAHIFEDRLSIEVANHLLPQDKRRLGRLARLGNATSVPLAVTGNAYYAIRDHYQRYDLLTCIRLGETVFSHHSERPKNGEAFLRPEKELRRLVPYEEAFDRTEAIAHACRVDLLPGHITPPKAQYQADCPPDEHLWDLCQNRLADRYNQSRRQNARRQLKSEIRTISELDMSEFFLVVREVVEAAEERGIRCAGRGSAANSIVAYMLGITNVDPLEHNLLFERFLHTGKEGTPDIDIDFDSDRRDEIIEWMEQRFGIEQTAMTATVVTYQLRSALRDVAKALGWPLSTINELTSLVPRRSAGRVTDYDDVIRRKLDKSPLTDTLIGATAALEECPRHLGLHSGGMLLSRRPLSEFTPIQRSANGVRMAQFDKRDVEAMGLVKLDVLGLRMLAALSETEETIRRHKEPEFDVDALPRDDAQTYNLIRSGNTVGLFQIESQGQHHLLAQHQPEEFQDLITQVALFRPGPLQGNMVHPYVRRRRGKEPVTYDHPSLEPILRDTYGIILFQEQLLEIAHQFAGMPLEEADRFRDEISEARDPSELEEMREHFVNGAVNNGIPRSDAGDVFEKVSSFVGYGFCRSHAAAFAETVYQSAYLKAHHPASFLAAVMTHRPGMYNQMTLEEEARRFEVDIRGPDIHDSSVRFDIEPDGDKWAIRKPLTSVEEVSSEDARAIIFERLNSAFESVEGVYRRVSVDVDVLRNLARSGALADISRDGRTALWEVGVLHERFGSPGCSRQPRLFDGPVLMPEDIPDLPELSERERLDWDLETHRAARRHPMTLVRRQLTDLEIRPIEMCQAFGKTISVSPEAPPPKITVAGISILRQKPSTANGVMFLTLEDETGHLQCVCQPEVQQAYGHVFRGGAVIAEGKLQIEGNWRGLVVTRAWRLDGIFGGYEGRASASGGRDRWIRTSEEADQHSAK